MVENGKVERSVLEVAALIGSDIGKLKEMQHVFIPGGGTFFGTMKTPFGQKRFSPCNPT